MLLSIASVFTVFLSLVAGLFLTYGNESYAILTKPNPDEIKAIYMTGYTTGWKQRRAELVDMIERTELNAVVIDIKDASGRIFFETDIPLAAEIGSEQIRIPDLADFIKELNDKRIYSIARIVVFNDPYLAQAKPELALKSTYGGLWRDYKGQAWVDPTKQVVWDYNIDLAKEAYELGFDEINFDYVRFPSDGPIRQIVYANLDNREKYEAMAEFYQYVGDALKFTPVNTSADLFGMVMWRNDGVGAIGQRYEDAAPHFDYISPMVYPSHYPPGFEGFANPADNPYEIIYRSLIRVEQWEGRNFRAKLRPWLQDFDLGAVYTPEMIRLQKQATYDSGATGWYLWNASNRYTEGGLEPATSE